MSIKAQINTDSQGNIIVHMKGGLNYDTSAPLGRELKDMAERNPRCTIILDLHKVEFVGSSGIGKFVETINTLDAQGQAIKLMNVKPEFLRVFKLYHLQNLERLLHEFDHADTTELGLWAGRRRTYEN